MMPHDDWGQGTQQIARDVAVGPPARNGKAKRASAVLRRAVRRLVRATLFDALGDSEQLEDRHGANRLAADLRKIFASSRRMILSPCPGAHAGECLANHSRALISKVSAA